MTDSLLIGGISGLEPSPLLDRVACNTAGIGGAQFLSRMTQAVRLPPPIPRGPCIWGLPGTQAALFDGFQCQQKAKGT